MEGEDFFDPKPKIQQEIKTEKQFWDAFIDSKNQFNGMQFLVFSKKEDIQVVEENSQITYLPFVEYITKNNYILSQEILDNPRVKVIIKIYDDLVERAKKAQTKAQMKQIIEERNETLGKSDLGIDKKE